MAEKSSQITETTSSKLSWSSGERSIGQVDEKEVNEDHDTVIRAVRKRPKAVGWCIFAMFILVVSSYTNIAGNSVLGIPQFRKDFGHPVDEDYALPAKWQAAFFVGGLTVAVVGALSAAWTADLLGRKPALALLLLLKLVSIVMEVAATENSVYFAALFLGGLTWGGFSGVVVTYVGEVSPLRLRGILTAALPLAICSGGLIVAIIIKYTGEQQSRWAYRTIFVSQLGFAGIAVIVLPFMPESPWWLEQSGRHIRALSTLRRLSYDETEAQAQAADILRTLTNSKDEASDASYLECFRGTNLRRTIISVMPMSIQALSGITFVEYYSTYYQQLAGYSTETSFHLFIVQIALSMSGIICSLPLIDSVGRRNLTLLGMSFLTVSLVITGGLAVAGTKGTIKGTVALLLLYCYVYNLTIGATAFSLSAEIATARLRAKTAGLTFALQGALFSMWGLVLPYLFNPDKANLGAKVTFIFGGLSVLSTAYFWFYQPEVAGRSYEELDEMFRRRVPARQFRTWKMAKVEREM